MNIKKSLFLVTFLLLLTVIFFPQLASTTIGKRIFIQAIQSRTHTTVAADEIRLSWLGPQEFSQLTFKSEQFEGALKDLRIGVPLWSLLPLFELKDLSKINGDIKIEDAAFQFNSDQFAAVHLDSIHGVMRFHAGGADFETDGQTDQNGQKGSYSFRGQIHDLKHPLPAFSIHGEWHSFPTLPIARIIAARYPIDENGIIHLLGDAFDLQGSASYAENEGVFEMALHAANIDSSVHGKIADHDLTLRKPMTATLRLTPELSQWILRDVNPLFVTGIEAQTPVHLRIEPSHFRCPILPFHLENLQIGHGTLELGQLRCFNGGSLSSVLSLLKIKSLSSAQQMDLWFSPLFFNLHDGVLETSRVDFLIDRSIHICTWGSIDYLNDQLDMFVGLPAETLQKSFGIEKLPTEYVMKIALTGSMKKPKLASHAAATKIAALLAAQQSHHSWLSSGIMSLFGETDTSVPPPNRPFPWEN